MESPYDTCVTGEYCDHTGTATCRPHRCSPGAAACSGETLAVCNEDGSGYASTSTNCALNDEVCDLVNGCSASAVDTVGSATLSSENPMPTLHLTVLEVLTPRTLTEIRSYFEVETDTEVVWVVYAALESSGTYAKILEVSGTATAGAATFHESGELSVPLELGHFYALGVLVRGPHTEYQSATTAEPISFAAVVGASTTTGSDVLGEIWVDVEGRATGFHKIATQ